MEPIYVYPGSFCPPTYGHRWLVEQASEHFGKVYVVCSTNPEKNGRWFSEEECKSLWTAYTLPAGVEVVTLSEFMTLGFVPKQLVMIRGIRNEDDAEHEKKVMLHNKEMFGIEKYFYIFSIPEFENVSSSKARKTAEALDFELLAELVAPAVVTRLLEKVLKLKNLFLVVGPPGSGKSTFLRMVAEHDETCVHLNTDDFNDQLRPFIQSRFPGEDLIAVARDREDELKELIKEPWFNLLRDAMSTVLPGSNLFVEIPYGLQPGKRMYRFVGGKVVYIGCEDRATLISRINGRGTPRIVEFVDWIPGKDRTVEICQEENLQLVKTVDTSCSLPELGQVATELAHQLKGD